MVQQCGDVGNRALQRLRQLRLALLKAARGCHAHLAVMRPKLVLLCAAARLAQIEQRHIGPLRHTPVQIKQTLLAAVVGRVHAKRVHYQQAWPGAGAALRYKCPARRSGGTGRAGAHQPLLRCCQQRTGGALPGHAGRGALCRFAHGPQAFRIGQQIVQRIGQRGFLRRHDAAIHAVLHKLRHPARICHRQHRLGRRHGFERNQPHVLIKRHKRHQRRAAVVLYQFIVIQAPDKADARIPFGQSPQIGSLRPIARNAQRHGGAAAPIGPHQQVDAFGCVQPAGSKNKLRRPAVQAFQVRWVWQHLHRNSRRKVILAPRHHP